MWHITLVRDILDEFRETADYDLSDVYSTHHLKRVIEYFIKNRSYVLNLYHSGYGMMLLNELNLFHESIAGNMPASSETRYKLYIYMGAIYNAAIIYMSEDNPKTVDELVRVLNHKIRNVDQTHTVVQIKHMLRAFIQIADIAQNLFHFGVDFLQKVLRFSFPFVADD